MERQVFPKFDLFPRLSRVARWVAEHASPLPSTTELCLSEHRSEE